MLRVCLRSCVGIALVALTLALSGCEEPARKAFDPYNEMIVRTPTNARGFYHRAGLNFAWGRDLAAESDYTIALDLSRRGDKNLAPSERLRAGYLRGLARIALGKWAPAESDLLRATRAYPRDARLWESLGYVRYRLREYHGAFAAFNKGVALPEDRYARGDISFQIGRYRRAVSELTEAIKERPSFGRAYQLRGQAEYQMHLYRRAEADFTRAIPLLPKAWAWAYRCETRESLGNVIGALSDCNRALAYYPRWPSAHLDHAWAEALLGFNQSALAEMRRGVEAAPSSPRAREWFAWQLARAGRYHGAFAEYARALGLGSGDCEIQRRRAALAHWLLKAQATGIAIYGIDMIDIPASLRERASLRPSAKRLRLCSALFHPFREYLDDCLDQGAEQAGLDRFMDASAAYQVEAGHYHVNAYVKARLALPHRRASGHE